MKPTFFNTGSSSQVKFYWWLVPRQPFPILNIVFISGKILHEKWKSKFYTGSDREGELNRFLFPPEMNPPVVSHLSAPLNFPLHSLLCPAWEGGICLRSLKIFSSRNANMGPSFALPQIARNESRSARDLFNGACVRRCTTIRHLNGNSRLLNHFCILHVGCFQQENIIINSIICFLYVILISPQKRIMLAPYNMFCVLTISPDF